MLHKFYSALLVSSSYTLPLKYSFRNMKAFCTFYLWSDNFSKMWQNSLNQIFSSGLFGWIVQPD